MIVTLDPEAPPGAVETVLRAAERFKGVTPKIHAFQGQTSNLTEVHLVGQTAQVPSDAFEGLPGVIKVVRVSRKYRLIGRHGHEAPSMAFECNGVRFGGDQVHIFAGLCAVDNREHVDMMMKAVGAAGLTTTRMGAYKPRTSPYDFQGLGKECLPYVFESAGKYGVRLVAMEVTDARQVDEIRDALNASGNATSVMLQIGTRNTQNFELLKAVGQQKAFPVLFKRGMGITLEESLNACEYVASEGNANIVFCLRGVKTHLGDPHRNLVDFAHVPVVRRLTRLPVCIDPSHSVGRLDASPDGVPDIFHVVGQGVVAGASMVLIDFHPKPELALCDGPQALTLERLPVFIRYVQAMRRAYNEAVSIVA